MSVSNGDIVGPRGAKGDPGPMGPAGPAALVAPLIDAWDRTTDALTEVSAALLKSRRLIRWLVALMAAVLVAVAVSAVTLWFTHQSLQIVKQQTSPGAHQQTIDLINKIEHVIIACDKINAQRSGETFRHLPLTPIPSVCP